jgi:hypothetical protein
MSWLDELAAELGARGVPAAQRRRILFELSDHIECDPGCEDRLGEPVQLAGDFADELATARTRGSAFTAFGALALAAVALVVSQLAIGPAGGYPGFDHGISLVLFVPALLGMFFAPQVALVTGSLAALRSARRRRAPRLPAAEIGLIGRRARVALLAGFGTVSGLGLYIVNFSQRLPTWYLGLVGGLTAVAGGALAMAYATLARADAITSGRGGAAGDVYDDVPAIGWRWLRRRPWRLGILGSVIVGLAATVLEAHAERSLSEGLQRGVVEGLAVVVGFAVLGRTVGLLPGHRQALPVLPSVGSTDTAHELIGGQDDRLAGDADRSYAEAILRDAFAQGRLGVDELTARVSAIHDATTAGELRAALAGLTRRS